jgi:hypothetical protein
MDRYGVLAQAAPVATVTVNLYWVPRGQKVENARIISCNRSAVPAAVRIAVAPEGAADSLEQFIAYDKEVPSLDTVASVEMVLGERSVVRVTSDTGDVSFTLFGKEQTL